MSTDATIKIARWKGDKGLASRLSNPATAAEAITEIECSLDSSDQCFYIAELFHVLGLACESFRAEAESNHFYLKVLQATIEQRMEALCRYLKL
jgi:hypothetical protein